jgi:hypothetical protein
VTLLLAINAHPDIDRRQPKETDMATPAPKRRSNKTSTDPNGSSETSAGQRSDAVRELALHATRVQLATLTAVSKLFVGWAQSLDRYAQAASDELLSRAHGETASRELVGRLATVSSRHLREVTALPTEAVNHFNSELTKATKPRTRRQQQARRRTVT